MMDVHFQVIPEEQPPLHAIEVGQQVVHRLLVELYHLETEVLALKEILGQHPHSRSHLEHVCAGRGLERGDYALRYPLVHQEMLA